MSMPEESPRYAGPRYGLAQNLNDGYQAGRDASLSPGLEAQSQRWNELAQGNLGKPTSVLSQIGLSSGRSATPRRPIWPTAITAFRVRSCPI